jgi:Sulfotransferase domain
MSTILKLPNFFIVGAPKAGTTSLYAYLGQHPQVYMSPVKEPSYFAPEQCRENFIFSWEGYLRLYRNVSDEIAIGEATASYLWSESAARNIAARLPHARIIINLRNPVDRAFSQYLQMLTEGVTRKSFREQIDASLRCRSKEFGLLWPFLEVGQYFEQIKRYFAEFPRSQIHISYYEDLEHAPGQLIADLFAFLGVEQGFVPDVSHRHNEPRIVKLTGAAYFLKKWRIWPYLRNITPRPLGPRLRSLMLRSRTSLQMEPADRAFLMDYYRDDIEKLAKLLDRDLTAWLD